jgi:lipopolysaccharide/colanic/teichoic acid biosynthesis glycosyltransferase
VIARVLARRPGRPTLAAKRAIDIVIAGIGTIVTAPVVGLLALAIRLESPGHPIYTQTRIGQHGRPFTIY